MRELSVAVVAENIVRRDGQGRVAMEIARTLACRGHRVLAVAAKIAPELEEVVEFARVAVGGGPQLMKDLQFDRGARRLLKDRALDVTLTMGSSVLPPGGPVVYYAAYTHHGWYLVWGQAGYRPGAYHRIHARWARRAERRALANAARVIVMADRMIEEVAAIGVPPESVSVIPGAVAMDEFLPADEHERTAARSELGTPGFTVGLIGEYSTGRKGLDVLAAAIAMGGGAECLVVHGAGPQASTGARLKDMGVEARFPDPAVPVRQVLAACDVVAIPSLYEPFSLVALECASAGVPVIISSVAGAADRLGPAGGAIVVPPNDPGALRRAIDSLRDSPEMRTAISVRARAAATQLDWKTITGRIADTVEQTSTARRAE